LNLASTGKIALVAALDREVTPLIKRWAHVSRSHDNRNYTFFEREGAVCICGGIGVQAARRAAEAVIALYNPAVIHSVGFAGGLNPTSRVGDILTPAIVLDARDNSRYQIPHGQDTLITFMEVASPSQKKKLAETYAAQAVDMEAAAVAAAAQLHNIPFAATKVISDGVDFEFPDISRFITAQGQFNSAGFALYAALRPWLWPGVAALAANSNKAATALTGYLKTTSPPQETSLIPTATGSTSGAGH
jgi:nucleoside phosphorylase